MRAARLYAESQAGGDPLGRAHRHGNPQGHRTAQAIACLWSITGNLDIPGGNVIAQPAFGVTTYPFSTQELHDLYGEEFVKRLNEKRIGADSYPCSRTSAAGPSRTCVLEQMETGEPYPIKACLDPDHQHPRRAGGRSQEHYQAALSKLEFNVVVDTFHDAHQHGHRRHHPAGRGHRREGELSPLVVARSSHTRSRRWTRATRRSDWEINLEMAKRLQSERPSPLRDGQGPVRRPPEAVRASPSTSWPPGAAGSLPRGTPTVPYRRHEKGLLRRDGQPGFRTPTGKVELYATSFEEWGLDPLPYYDGAAREPAGAHRSCGRSIRSSSSAGGACRCSSTPSTA